MAVSRIRDEFGRFKGGAPKATCGVDGCDKHVLARGLCRRHYARLMRDGDPLTGTQNPEFRKCRKWLDEHAGWQGDECLPWPFAIGHMGRGVITMGGRKHNASRVMCILAHGEPPTPNHHAAHLCGNGHLACVNPRHLEWKTPAENAADRAEHGTLLVGERNHQAKLSDAEVRRIIEMGEHTTQTDLARQFGVSQAHIWRILNRLSRVPADG